jgi:molybdopterin-dependent oxidoreductase alpha subunit
MKSVKKPDAGGGLHALKYTFNMGARVGFLNLWKAMSSKNACKTCALGMGGQKGGMRNELGHWPEVCKKSLQAMAADMQGRVGEQFFREYSLRQMQSMSPRELETAGRLTFPLWRAPGATHYQPVSWEKALSVVAGKLKAVSPEESFFYFSGRSSNEAAFLLQLFARLYGTNHVNNCSYYCHQASGVGLSAATGSGTATISADDIDHADLYILIGGNPASNHPRLMTHLMRLRRRGGQVVVVNPVKETGLVRFRIPSDMRSMLFGTDIASDYVQVSIGGDIAFMLGVAKALFESHAGSLDRDFIRNRTEDYEAVASLVDATSWQDIVSASGVSEAEIRRVGAVYARSERTIFGWTMGITHHEFGVQNVQWIVNLALLRGMIGRPGAGLMPIRGHSNVQGIGSIGVTPALKAAVAERYESNGLRLPTHKGYDTMECMVAAVEGSMRVGWALGGNLYGSNPDAGFAGESLNKLDLMVYMNTSLNTGHAHATGKETIIFPVLARDEEPYRTTQESMFNFVRLSDGGATRHEGVRSELDVIADVAHLVMQERPRDAGGEGSIAWDRMRDANAVRSWIARLVPGFESLADIDQTKKEFHIPGRVLHQPEFPTASGRARFHAHPIPTVPAAAGSRFNLMTVRSEGQFNTVVYEEEDLYRGQERRDVILMHPDDMRRLNLSENQQVQVKNDTGSMRGILVRPFDIRPGNVLMYYPEANVLVPRLSDPSSKTPAFKCIPVYIVAAGGGTGGFPAAGNAAPRTFLRRLINAWRLIRRKPRLNAC